MLSTPRSPRVLHGSPALEVAATWNSHCPSPVVYRYTTYRGHVGLLLLYLQTAPRGRPLSAVPRSGNASNPEHRYPTIVENRQILIRSETAFYKISFSNSDHVRLFGRKTRSPSTHKTPHYTGGDRKKSPADKTEISERRRP